MHSRYIVIGRYQLTHDTLKSTRARHSHATARQKATAVPEYT